MEKKELKNNCVIIVISEDGMIDILPVLEKNETTCNIIETDKDNSEEKNIKIAKNAILGKNNGDKLLRESKFEEAIKSYNESLENYKIIGDRNGVADIYISLGDLYIRIDMLKESEEYYNKCLPIYKEIGSKLGEANTYQSLGDLYIRNSKLKEAEESYNKCLPIYKEIGAKLGEANILLRIYIKNNIFVM